MWDKQPEVKHGIRSGVLMYDWHFRFMDTWFLIQAMFTFNGASIPFVLWTLIAFPFSPWVIPAALIHDWFYQYHREKFTYVWGGIEYRPIKRREADRAFLKALVFEINRRYKGTSRIMRIKRARKLWRAHAMYIGVRDFGWAFWKD